MNHVLWADEWIDWLVVADNPRFSPEAVYKEAINQRMVSERAVARPVRRLQVAVHQELGEGEKPEHDVVGVDLGPPLARDRLFDGREVLRGCEILDLGYLGQLEAEVSLEFLDERKVRRDVLLEPRQSKPLQRAPALEVDRDEQERRVTGSV